MKTVRRPPYPKWNPGYFPCSSLTPLPLSSRRPSVSFGGFGLKRHLSITVTGRSLCGLVDADAFDQPDAVSCTPCADAARMFYTAIKGPEWVKENL